MTRMSEAVEQVFVQALIPHASVEGLHKAVLHWLARGDVVPVNLAVLLPFQDRIGSQFGPIVADHHAGVTNDVRSCMIMSKNTLFQKANLLNPERCCAAQPNNHRCPNANSTSGENLICDDHADKLSRSEWVRIYKQSKLASTDLGAAFAMLRQRL